MKPKKIKKKMKRARKRSKELFVEAAKHIVDGNEKAAEIAMMGAFINAAFGRKPKDDYRTFMNLVKIEEVK